ncbi:MAG: 50S ribosomal protein L18 [Candidatus Saccharibacteria bacterium]|nr:50S ribosomal protein L18 [Candidatus Saccharibacteria bacterium]
MSNRLHVVKTRTLARDRRVKQTLTVSADRPRLTVSISNRHVLAQIIDDTKHHTLVFATTVGAKNAGKTMTERAVWVGTEVAKKAKVKKITKVAFDRNSHLYHGRVKALADAAREAGLEF